MAIAWRLRRRAAVFSAVLSLQVLAAGGRASSQEAVPHLSTPQLIERALERGRLDRATADRYLAYALGVPDRLPSRFVSQVPWDGTLPLLHLRERLAAMPPGPNRAALGEALHPTSCQVEPAGPDTINSTFFHVHYDDATLDPDLDINDYLNSLDSAWDVEVNDFGWAAPPLGGFSKYPVVISQLGDSLYGFVAFTGPPGDNPNTPWNDVDAFASCMSVNEDFTGFPSTPQASLDATTAHEFNHSIQFGYGALTGPNAADDVFVEGGATWMEDEVFDAANDNYNYLWPDVTESMGAYGVSPYPYWVVFRTMTERFGSGGASGGEDVMQRFWELVSQSATSIDLNALNSSLGVEGTNLADAYHAAAVALKFNLPCSGTLTYPHCLEEGSAYVAAAGPTPVHGSISSVNGSFTGSIEDDYALNWVTLPPGPTYPVTLRNNSPGGELRATIACPTASGLSLTPFPALVPASTTVTMAALSTSGCTAPPVAVITNQAQTTANPPASTGRSYTLSTTPGNKSVRLKAKPKKVDAGDRTRLTAKVSACDAGDPVDFYRGSKKIATKAVSAACVAKHRVKVPKTTRFQAVAPADDDGAEGRSKKVRVKVRKP